jgi:hypothetical protein
MKRTWKGVFQQPARIESASLKVSNISRQKMKDALEWLASPERQCTNWSNITKGCGYAAGVLFAYPEEVPEMDTGWAALLTGEQLEAQDEAGFEQQAKPVVKALQGLVKDKPTATIQVFALAKIDKGRTKVMLNRRFSASRLLEAAQHWQKGGTNLPSVAITLGKGKQRRTLMPQTPFPYSPSELLNHKWFQDGVTSRPVKGPDVTECLLLLTGNDKDSRKPAWRMLQLWLANVSNLLLAAGAADHNRDGNNYSPPKSAFDEIPYLLGLAGILLNKLGKTKEAYMLEASFLVGRLLSMVDLLHKEYCRKVRKGQIPPQLLGNSLMRAAMDNPQRALARLQERLVVYQAWANTTPAKEKGDLWGWALREMGLISAQIAEIELPDSTTDTDKAQILLGYLYRRESGSRAKGNGDVLPEKEN